MADITLTFPDGASATYPARHHRPGGRQGDLPVAGQALRRHGAGRRAGRSGRPHRKERDAQIRGRASDPEALELIRHDAAHVLAEAVQDLWPGTQVTIGPVIENGFYYDFDKAEPFVPEDLPKIEARMREIIKRNAPFTKEVWTRDEGQGAFRGARRALQGRAGRRHSGRPDHQDL